MKLKKYGTLMLYNNMGLEHLEELIETWKSIKRVIPSELLYTVETRIEIAEHFEGCFAHIWAERFYTEEELRLAAEKELRNRELRDREQKTIEYYRLKRELGL